MTHRIWTLARCIASAALIALAGCGGGGGSSPGFAPSPLAGDWSGASASAGAQVVVDPNGYMIASVASSLAESSQSVTFSGTVVDQGEGRWSIPFALISTTVTPAGKPAVQTTTRAPVTGTWASRNQISFTLPAAAVPAGLAASHAVAYGTNQPIPVVDISGHYVAQGAPVREFDVFTSARFTGTYIPGCVFDGTIYAIEPQSAVLTADVLLTGAACPNGAGYERRLIGSFTRATATASASLDMRFVDNGGSLHRISGVRSTSR